jgi:hypothetical protein
VGTNPTSRPPLKAFSLQVLIFSNVSSISTSVSGRSATFFPGERKPAASASADMALGLWVQPEVMRFCVSCLLYNAVLLIKCTSCTSFSSFSDRLPDGRGSNLGPPLGADLIPIPIPFWYSSIRLHIIMVLLDEKQPKWETAPPAYFPRNSTAPTTSLNAAAAPPPFSRPRTRVTFISLPQHILLEIIQTSVAPNHTSWTEHRLALWWLATELRLACRAIYTGTLVPQPCLPA